MSNPSELDFARARAAARERERGLSEVRTHVLETCRDRNIHEFFLFYSPNTRAFVAHIFFETEKQKNNVGESDVSRIRDVILDGLEMAGRGDRDKIGLEIVLGSHEKVLETCDGDYLSFLR